MPVCITAAFWLLLCLGGDPADRQSPNEQGAPAPGVLVGPAVPVSPPVSPKPSVPAAPSGPPVPTALPVSTRPSIEISRLRVGAPPYTWVESQGLGSSRPATFVTDSDRSCTVVAWARVRGASAKSVRWQIIPPAGFALPATGLPSGSILRVTLLRTDGNPSGGGGPLTVSVRARVERDGQKAEASGTVTQDERDQMRQEYVDLRREVIPSRHRFLDAAAYVERYGVRFPQVRFEELNWSVNPESGDRYRYIMVSERLLEGLARARAIYGRPLIFSSGYRNPTRQVEVHAPVKESLHQYGLAADLVVFPDAAPPLTGRVAPNEADWLRFAESACAAGASWVEPMSECAVNTPGCHLHMDFRVEGPRSTPVALKGRVLDAETGEPLPGAEVRLAGMQGRTDATGAYTVRNILTPRERPVEVTALGYQPLIQAVPIAPGLNPLDVRLRTGPRPRLVATVAQSRWQDESRGLAVVELRLRNNGERSAHQMTVAPPAIPGAAEVVELAPREMSSLLINAEEVLRLTLKVTPEPMPSPQKLVLRVSGRDSEGAARTQKLICLWTPPAATPAVAAATPISPKTGTGILAVALTLAVRTWRRSRRRAAPA